MVIITNAAESNRAIIYYIPEVTWGTRPASGVVKTMRILNSSIVPSKETVMSEELRADRMVPAIVEVSASTGGDIEWEFSAGGPDDFFQYFLLGAWTEQMTHFVLRGTAVTITANNVVTLVGADYTNYLNDEDYIKLEGFTNVGNNGHFSIDSLAFSGGNTVVTVDGTLLTVEAGSAYTKIVDASDVILKSTTTAFTSGNTINGGGSNSFSGKSLFVGQTIYVEGLGKGSGSLVVGATDPAEGDTIIISDGIDEITYEIRTNSALVSPGNIHVALSGTPLTMATSLTTAINARFLREACRVTAVSDGVDTLTLTNHRGTGGSIATASGGFTETTFSGGSNSKHGYFTIASLPNDDTIVTVETLTTDANSDTLAVIIKGSHLRNPGTVASITKQSISGETSFTDINKHMDYRGLRLGSFNLAVSVGEIVNGSFSLMGRDTTTAAATVLGNPVTYTVLNTTNTEVFNATSNVGSIKRDGVVLDVAITDIELEGDAGLREQRAVGERFPAGIGYGRMTLQGSFTAFFTDFTLFDSFLDHSTLSLSFDFEDADHNAYIFTVPSLKLTSDPIAPGGIDQDVMESIEFMAQRSASLNTMFMIDRFSSVYPMSAVA